MDNVIDLTEDDSTELDSNVLHDVSDDGEEEDEHLKLAIALSLQNEETNPTILTNASQPQPLQHQCKESPVEAPSSSLLGLDRKAMENERLARLKRKRNDTQESSISDAVQPPTTKRKTSPSPPPRQAILSSSMTTSSTKSSFSSRAERNQGPRIPPERVFSFPHAKILLTATPSRFSATNDLEAISFTDILHPPALLLSHSRSFPSSSSSSGYTLKSALLSSFITDFDWLFPHFQINGPGSVKFVLVLHAHDTRHRQLLRADFGGLKSIRLVMPEISAGGFGTMHSKFMLLFFTTTNTTQVERTSIATTTKDEICRIVVPSANLVPYDWGVGGVMENILYVIDLPAKTEQQRKNMDVEETQFETSLKQQLNAMGVPADVLRKLTDFDFSATNGTGFVHTISGSHPLASANSLAATGSSVSPVVNTGLLSLSKCVVSLGLSISATSPAYPPQLDFVTSSLGNLSTAFLRQLHQAACGTLDPNSITTTMLKRKLASDEQQKLDDVIKRNLRIYFPSAQTVQKSKGGEPCAGTICFQKKWWEENDLIRHCMHDCVGVRGDGILMHSKILYASFKQPVPVKAKTANGTTGICSGFAYIGSANLSESAWGKITNDAKSKMPKMTSRNWESGVIIPVFANNDLLSEPSSDKSPTQAKLHVQTGGVTENGSGSMALDKLARSEEKGVKSCLGCDDTCKRRCGRHLSNATSAGAEQGAIKCVAKDRQMPDDVPFVREPSSTVDEIFFDKVPVPVQTPAPNVLAVSVEPWFFKD